MMCWQNQTKSLMLTLMKRAKRSKMRVPSKLFDIDILFWSLFLIIIFSFLIILWRVLM